MTGRTASLLVGFAALTSLACGKSDPTGKSLFIVEQQPTGTIVSTRDGAKFYGDDAAVDVYNYGTLELADKAVLVFLAYAGSDLWTAQAQVPRDTLPTGDGSANIRQVPLEVGIANVERQRDGEAIARPTSGTFAYHLGTDQRLNVTVDSDDLVAGTVSARFQIRCWVPRSELPRTDGQSSGQTDGGVEMALDDQYSTPQCAAFKDYGP